MLTAELIHRRGKTTHVSHRGPCRWEGVILFTIYCAGSPEAELQRVTFHKVEAGSVAAMLEEPGDGYKVEDEQGRILVVQRDTITIAGQAYPVTEEDRLRLAQRIQQFSLY